MGCTGKYENPFCNLSLKHHFFIYVTWPEVPSLMEKCGFMEMVTLMQRPLVTGQHRWEGSSSSVGYTEALATKVAFCFFTKGKIAARLFIPCLAAV